MSIYDLSHVMDVGMRGSEGPAVGLFDMVQQSFRQQFRVDSARALDEEIGNRWIQSLRQLSAAGGGQFEQPLDPNAYRAFAEHVRNQPITALSGTRTEGQGYGARFVEGDPTENPYFQQVQQANEAIKRLNNPNIHSFEQILDEVSSMQRGIEEQTASMSERAGGITNLVGSLIGGAAGSFTLRDPLNVVTAPLGAGETIAARIAIDMGIAAATTAITEYNDVQPARQLAGLPERSALWDIGVATLGAGIIRGALFEPAGHFLRLRRERLAEERQAFDLRDSQLQQMFGEHEASPTARAGSYALDGAALLRNSNPYGYGREAQERFMTELRDVQRVMGGEPMTAIARVLPPLPYDLLEKQADFQLVKEQSPIIYGRMEVAHARLQELQEQVARAEQATTSATSMIDKIAKLVHKQPPERVSQAAKFEEYAHNSAIADYATEHNLDVLQVGRHYATGNDPALKADIDRRFTEILDKLNRIPSLDELNELPSGHEAPSQIDLPDQTGAQMESIKARPGVNAGRMAKMLGPQLYGDMSNMGAVGIKEVMQNSFDAIKTALLRQGGKGKIDIVTRGYNREIEMTDNGVGMTPETLGTKFLEIAGTGKEEGASSGGFGIAKMLFLYGNDDLHVITMRDGKVSEMKTTGADLFKALEDPQYAPDIEVREPTEADRAMFPDGSGTRVTMKIPESFKDPKTGDQVPIDFPRYEWDVPSLSKSPLFADIDVNMNGSPIAIGSQFPLDEHMPFANIDFGWGKARIYVTREPKNLYADNVHILSNGIHQFSQRMTKKPLDPYSGVLPYEFYIDISPHVAPDEPGYPFNFNRQALTEKAKKDLNGVLSYINALYAFNDMAKSAESFGSARYFSDATGSLGFSVDLKPTLSVVNKFANSIGPGDEVFVRDGRMYVNGKELPTLKEEDLKEGIPQAEELKIDPHLIDPDRIMVHENVSIRDDGDFGNEIPFVRMLQNEFGDGANHFLYSVGDIFRQLRNHVADLLNYKELKEEAIGLSFDPEYRGVSIRLPFSGSFINPFLAESDDIVEAAYGTFGTMIHELAHHKVRSHNAQFPAEMQKLWYKLQANRGDVFLQLQQMLIDAFKKDEEVFRGGRELLEGGNAEVAGNRLGGSTEDPNATGRPEGVPDGNDPSGPEGVGPRGIPEEAERGADIVEPGRITASDAGQPQTLEQLRQLYREANAEYQAAYKEVQAEAARLKAQRDAIQAAQQHQAVNIFSAGIEGRTFNAALLTYDHVESVVDQINKFNETVDDRTLARFVRETVGEGEDAVEKEVWRTDNGIDIGLAKPVDPEFRFASDDGDMTIEAAMRDLQDDADLDEAMRTCLL